MPGVDFDVLRREITMQQVLDEIGFSPPYRDGDQFRGPCPVHESKSKNSRAFSLNLGTQRDYGHKCKSHGTQLELYAAARDTKVNRAAIDFCHTLGGNVPWIKRR